MHGLIVALVAASAAAQTCPASLISDKTTTPLAGGTLYVSDGSDADFMNIVDLGDAAVRPRVGKLACALFYRAITFGRNVERANLTFEKCQSRAKNIGMGLRNDSTWPRWYFPEGVMVVALRKHGVGVETIYRRHDHMIDRTGCEP